MRTDTTPYIKRISEAEAAELIGRYEAGLSIYKIAAECDRPPQTVYKLLKRSGVAMRAQSGRPRRTLSDAEREYLRNNYPGQDIPQLATRLRCSGTLVSRALKEMGIKTRQSGWQPKLEPGKADAILAAWRSGKAANAINAELGTGTGTVKTVLTAAGIPWENRLRRGAKSPAWKGGRIRWSGGYDDNRLENLQLRTGRHGKGVVMHCLDCGSHNVETVEIADPTPVDSYA